MKKKLLIMIGSVCLILVLAALLLPACAKEEAPAAGPAVTAPTPAEVIHWKLQTSTNPLDPMGPYKYPFGMVWTFGWSDWLREVSNGRLDIEVIGPGVAFPSEEGLTAIGSGVAEVAYSGPGWWTEKWPVWYVGSGLPGSWSNAPQVYDVFYNYGLVDIMTAEAEERNLLVLPLPHTPHLNIMSTFPMPDSSSIKGKKIRIYGPWGPYIEMFGGKPTRMAYGDLYMGMKLGTIDGLMTTSMGLEAMKLKEVVTDFITNVNPSIDVFLINLDAFKALPEDIQETILRESPYHLLEGGCMIPLHEDYLLRGIVEETGLRLWTWSDEEMTKVRKDCIEKIWPEFREKGPEVSEAIDIVLKQLEDHGKL